MKNILELRNVVKKYHNYTAVNNVSFDVPQGSIFGFLGPNGAGKTSTIRIITTITKADSGQVLFEGEPLNSTHPSQIGYMPEERGLYKKMKVGEVVLYLAQLKGMSKKDAKAALDYWLEKFEIQDWLNKPVEELSKGMQQKVQFITTVLHRPKLLILDEPFSGLDPVNSNLIQDEIDELHRNGTTILFSTHRMEQIEQICDYIVLINKGQNVLTGGVKDIKNQFKKHLFRVEYQGELPNLDENPYFRIVEHTPQAIKQKLPNAVLQLVPNVDSNDVLRYLLSKDGFTIAGFQEILPTFNEIFIQTVKPTADHE